MDDIGSIGPARGRLYDMHYSPEQRASVAELLTSYNAVAQISELPDHSGFLIRVWPPGGTVEFGGNNVSVLSAVVKFGADLKARVTSLHVGES